MVDLKTTFCGFTMSLCKELQKKPLVPLQTKHPCPSLWDTCGMDVTKNRGGSPNYSTPVTIDDYIRRTTYFLMLL